MCTVHTNSALRKMPITSSNNLTHIALIIGTQKDGSHISTLFDTGAALITGYLPFHMFNKLAHPNMVHSYESFDGNNPFDPITLTGAINNTQEYDTAKHGILSALIRYYTPYQDSNGNCLIFPVALGNDITVNTILGTTVIDQ